jgi:hypothetical protein
VWNPLAGIDSCSHLMLDDLKRVKAMASSIDQHGRRPGDVNEIIAALTQSIADGQQYPRYEQAQGRAAGLPVLQRLPP